MARTFSSAPTGVLSLIAVGIIVTLAIVGPSLFGQAGSHVDMGVAGQQPSRAHWLGTDPLGRDILARTLAATRLSLGLSFAAVGLAAAAGILAGLLIASSGRRSRQLGSTALDAMLSFGDVLLAIVVIAILGPGSVSAVIAVAVAFTPAFARLTNTLASSVGGREYVAAARVVGVSRARILRRYILPNIADSMIVGALSALGEGIIALSSLSFLGLGVQQPQYDWGQMLTVGVQAFYINAAAALAPAVMIVGTGAAMALLGDALARAVNPLIWTERPRRFRLRGRLAPVASPGSPRGAQWRADKGPNR